MALLMEQDKNKERKRTARKTYSLARKLKHAHVYIFVFRIDKNVLFLPFFRSSKTHGFDNREKPFSKRIHKFQPNLEEAKNKAERLRPKEKKQVLKGLSFY